MENLSVKDVAKMLGVSKETVRKGILNGDLPFGTVVRGERNVYIIPREKYERWLQNV